jgi:hypothetical protein
MGSAQVRNGGYLTQSRHQRLGESPKADIPTADGGQKRPIGNLSIGLPENGTRDELFNPALNLHCTYPNKIN